MGSDFIGLSLLGNEIDEVRHGETFICSSLFQISGGKSCLHIRSSKQASINMLIVVCGDVQPCPGSSTYARSIQELESLIKAKGIKICHKNGTGLSGSCANVAELLQSLPGLHILSLSESHIDMRSEHGEVVHDIAGYSFISRPRNSGKGGGFGAYIMDGIIWDRREDLKNENVEAIRLEFWPIHSKTSYCVQCIAPWEFNVPEQGFNNHLHEMLSKASEISEEIILMGDLYVNFLKQDNTDLKSILHTFGFKQMIPKSMIIAKTSETLIDVILTNKPSNVVTTNGCTRKINHLRFKPR